MYGRLSADQPLPCLPSVFTWRQFFVGQETSVEVGDILVPDVKTNTGDLLIGVGKQVTSLANPDLGQKFAEGVTGRFLEKAREVALIHPQHGCHLFLRDVVLIALDDELDDRVDLVVPMVSTADAAGLDTIGTTDNVR